MLNWSERGHVLATATEDVVYFQVVGVANMNNVAPFEEFARLKQDGGCREFIFDFSECEGLDSTFLGIVLGLRLGQKNSDGTPPQITAVNASLTVKKIFSEVGIDRLIQVLPDPVALPEIPMQKLERDCSEKERLDMVLSAHETLCNLGDDNSKRFGAFVELLRKEIDRTAFGSGAPNAAHPSEATKKQDDS